MRIHCIFLSFHRVACMKHIIILMKNLCNEYYFTLRSLIMKHGTYIGRYNILLQLSTAII
jgi:hypothetical protein